MIAQQTANAPLSAIEILRQLKTNSLLIHTIPGEEWLLSCTRHKTLLVDVYSLSGTIARRKQTYTCGRISEIILKLLRTGRKAQYVSHNKQPTDSNVRTLIRTGIRQAETLEEDAMMRLASGDMIFYATGEAWRLTNTWFGTDISLHSLMFHFAKEDTRGTPDLRIYKSTKLEYVLLDFLCQDAEFVEAREAKILTFSQREQ
jgi:hypothetical protein